MTSRLDSAPLSATPESDRRSARARARATTQEASRPQPRGPLRRLVRLVADVWRKSDRDRLLGLAAENAFLAVLTVFPTLLVVASVLGQLSLIIGPANAQEVETEVVEFLRSLLTDSAAPALDSAEQLFRTGGDVLTLASVLALGALATAFAGIVNTVTIAYDVQDTRGWWKRRFLGLLIGFGSILTAVVVVTLVVVGPLFAAEDVVAQVGLERYASVWSYLRWPVAVLSLVLWATTMDHVCPDRQGRWRDDLPGGLLTAVLWLGASVGFNLYLQVALQASPVFSYLGGGLIVMTWLYLLCLGLLIGAELNGVLLARRRGALLRAHEEQDRAAPDPAPEPELEPEPDPDRQTQPEPGTEPVADLAPAPAPRPAPRRRWRLERHLAATQAELPHAAVDAER